MYRIPATSHHIKTRLPDNIVPSFIAFLLNNESCRHKTNLIILLLGVLKMAAGSPLLRGDLNDASLYDVVRDERDGGGGGGGGGEVGAGGGVARGGGGQ